MFGHTGSGPGCFKDPAGLAVDRLPCHVWVCTGNHVCLFFISQEFNFSVWGTCWWRTAGTTDCASTTPTGDFSQRFGLD